MQTTRSFIRLRWAGSTSNSLFFSLFCHIHVLLLLKVLQRPIELREWEQFQISLRCSWSLVNESGLLLFHGDCTS